MKKEIVFLTKKVRINYDENIKDVGKSVLNVEKFIEEAAKMGFKVHEDTMNISAQDDTLYFIFEAHRTIEDVLGKKNQGMEPITIMTNNPFDTELE